MKYDPDKHHRRSIRLEGYDYAQDGGYFVTICVFERKHLFGNVVDGEMILNEIGKLVKFTWLDLPRHNKNVELDEYIIMPNHIHGIIIISGAGLPQGAGLERAGLEPAPTDTAGHGLSEIVRQFKTFSAKRVNQINNTAGTRLWQRNYYEHIIRNENDLLQIREYINNNPYNWENDDYFQTLI
jgi:putative transposase